MPVLSWAYQPDKMTVRYDYDVEKAKQLLDEAGWTEGADGSYPRARRARGPSGTLGRLDRSMPA